MSSKKNKQAKKERRKILKEIATKVNNNKSALSGNHTYIGIVNSHGGMTKVRVPDLDMFEMFSDINEAVLEMPKRIENKLMELYNFGKEIPKSNNANAFSPKRNESLRLFIARDPSLVIAERKLEMQRENNRNVTLGELFKESEILKAIDDIKEEDINKEIKEKATNNESNTDTDKQSKSYKHICPICGKEFYLTAKQEYNANRRRRLNPNMSDICCSRSCSRSLFYKNNVKINTTIKENENSKPSLYDEIKERILNRELHCCECGVKMILDLQTLDEVIKRIMENPSDENYILNHLYHSEECYEKSLSKENNSSEDLTCSKTIEEIYTLDDLLKILDYLGLKIDSIKFSKK